MPARQAIVNRRLHSLPFDPAGGIGTSRQPGRAIPSLLRSGSATAACIVAEIVSGRKFTELEGGLVGRGLHMDDRRLGRHLCSHLESQRLFHCVGIVLRGVCNLPGSH